MTDDKVKQLETARRTERLAEAIAPGACKSAESGHPVDLESARLALEVHRRAKELREHLQAEVERSQTGKPPKDVR